MEASRHRFYVVDGFAPTNFHKVSGGGMIGHRYFDNESLAYDVGVDRWGYRPASIGEIHVRLAATDTLPEERRRAAERDAAEGDNAE
ncbi:hypothetical protein [Methylorubrum extorquens]|uniref:Uncharacterized protein n=1 Tax=Methylorubrum extorquens TaxID=408 RepID=A0AAX3WB81_METEX|nr:hypothetical protein [Methylorubrum extorquens]WHQ68567.1 hypothetical protein KEC54_19605 [Methylorubrum extorquens]